MSSSVVTHSAVDLSSGCRVTLALTNDSIRTRMASAWRTSTLPSRTVRRTPPASMNNSRLRPPGSRTTLATRRTPRLLNPPRPVHVGHPRSHVGQGKPLCALAEHAAVELHDGGALLELVAHRIGQ